MTNQDRHIVHMDLDAFFVSVEELMDSSLKGKPVVIGSTSGRGVVSAASYAARQFGIHAAMPMKMALRLCPNVIVRRGDMEAYSQKSQIITEIIGEETPLFEKSSIDEFYLDITGMDRFFGCYQWATELRSRITKETGLPISFGLASNKTVSKMATNEAKPNGQIHIPFDVTQQFLNPLPVQRIPMVGDQTCKKLRYMGLYKIEQVTQIAMDVMERVMGKNGVAIWKKAHGIDQSLVVPYHERKSISTERTFHQDTIDVSFIRALLVSMVEKLSFQLRKEGKLSACITLKLRYSNFDTHTMQTKMAYTSNENVLIEKANMLFDKVFQRRMRIRLVGIRLSDLVYGAYQIDLFNDDDKTIRLNQAMDVIRNRFGYDAVKRAVGMEISSRQGKNPFHG